MTDNQIGTVEQNSAPSPKDLWRQVSLVEESPAVKEQTSKDLLNDVKNELPESQVQEGTKEVSAEESPKELRKFKVKVDQEEFEVDEEELKKSYSRQSDYSRKTQELAEQRKSLEKEKTEIELKYAEKLQWDTDLFEIQLKKEFGDIKWQELEQIDREEWNYQKTKFNERKAELDSKKIELKELYENQNKQQEKIYKDFYEREKEALYKADPDFADPDKKIHKEILSYLKSNDFSEQEIGGFNTHKIYLLIKKAIKYDALQNKVDLKAKKVVTTPSIQKSSNYKPLPQEKNTELLKNASKGDKNSMMKLWSQIQS